MTKNNLYLKFVDMRNLTKQKCDTSSFEVSHIGLETIDPNDQELHFLVWSTGEKDSLTYEKKIECSIPSYMHQLCKDPFFVVQHVLCAQKAKNRILQLEGYFTSEKKRLSLI
jgi:hypothetical protein